MKFLPLLLFVATHSYLALAQEEEVPSADEPSEGQAPSNRSTVQIVIPPPGIAAYSARDDYTYTAVGAHKLHTRPMVWNDARRACNDEGAHLAIINSIVEAEVMADILNNATILRAPKDRAYLGVHDYFKTEEWVTIFSEPLESTGYSQWSPIGGGQPNNYTGNDHCLTILPDGKLNDNSCQSSLAFFCEIPTTTLLRG